MGAEDAADLLENSISVRSGEDAGAKYDCRMLSALQLLEEIRALQHGSQSIWPLSQVVVRVGEVILWPHQTYLCTLQPDFA